MRGSVTRLLKHWRKVTQYNGPSIVYTHIPKCGGTSVDAAIRSCIGRADQPRINPVAARKAGQLVADTSDPVAFVEQNSQYLQYLLCYHLNLGWRFVSGHLPVNSDVLEFYKQYKFVTILRDPIERWTSHYLFNKMTNPDPMVPPSKEFPGTIEEEFDQLIDSGRGQQMGSLITMMLTGRYPKSRDEATDLSLQASRNIERFSVIGFLHNLKDFEVKFSKLTSTDIRIGHKNQTERDHINDQQNRYYELKEFLKLRDAKNRIAECCLADKTVYQHAVSLEQVAAPDG